MVLAMTVVVAVLVTLIMIMIMIMPVAVIMTVCMTVLACVAMMMLMAAIRAVNMSARRILSLQKVGGTLRHGGIFFWGKRIDASQNPESHVLELCGQVVVVRQPSGKLQERCSQFDLDLVAGQKSCHAGEQKRRRGGEDMEFDAVRRGRHRGCEVRLCHRRYAA